MASICINARKFQDYKADEGFEVKICINMRKYFKFMINLGGNSKYKLYHFSGKFLQIYVATIHPCPQIFKAKKLREAFLHLSSLNGGDAFVCFHLSLHKLPPSEFLFPAKLPFEDPSFPM